MKVPPALLSMRRPTLALCLAATLGGVAACSGSSSPAAQGTASPSTSGDTSAAVPSGSSSSAPPASGSAVKSVAPVPVESNPPGDIPDNLAFVKYSNPAGRYSFTHPEGWAQTGKGTAVRFTDKLNGVTADSTTASQAPTVASARSTEVPRLQSSVPAFDLRGVSAVTLPGGKGVKIVFRRNSDPDPVTGKVYRDEVEEYVVFHGGRQVTMDLYGPVGADNVDAYRTMSQSLMIR